MSARALPPFAPSDLAGRIFAIRFELFLGLYLVFSIALFLGLQVKPLYGNIGIAAVAILAALYVYIGFFRK